VGHRGHTVQEIESKISSKQNQYMQKKYKYQIAASSERRYRLVWKPE